VHPVVTTRPSIAIWTIPSPIAMAAILTRRT
jgi:hypothetical protein